MPPKKPAGDPHGHPDRAEAPAVRRCPGCGLLQTADAGCPRCVTCQDCDEAVPEGETTKLLDGCVVCRNCRDTHGYWHCYECGGWNHADHSCDNGCDDPDDYDNESSDLVYPYGYKPKPVFHGSGPLYLGPEIEVEAPYDRYEQCAELAYAYLGRLGYLKEDDSLHHGFEIVTHPMSYPWAIEHFPWRLLTELHEAGCAVSTNTGLHVHISRAGFATAGHTYRWMKFIHRNRRQVTTLARRSSPEYAAFTGEGRHDVKHYAKGAGSHNRYQAINPNNPDTFELRVFASSLAPDEVKAAFGFAAASVEYTRDLSVARIATDGGWTWASFVHWLHQHPDYEPLSTVLEDLQCVC